MTRWPPRSDIERFIEKVRFGSGECWEWTGSRLNSGYGSFYYDGSGRPAHRVSYQLFVGDIPPRLEIDHLCRNKLCVNPAHLEAVTRSTNQLRVTSETHCPNGHARTPENTRFKKSGVRVCIPCARASTASYDRRHPRRLRAAVAAPRQ